MNYYAYSVDILVSIAWIAYLTAAALKVMVARKKGDVFFALGFCLTLAAVIIRALLVRRLPMQGMYEIFLIMGAAAYPVALTVSRITGKKPGFWDVALGALLLSPAIFVFDPTPRPLPPVLNHWLFGPHVAAYLLGYLIMFRAGILAFNSLLCDSGEALDKGGQETRKLLILGMPILTLGLALGAYWGKLAWGNYWNWDPKEMWAMAMWLVFAAALYCPAPSCRKRTRRTAVLAILGCALILCTLLLANLSKLFEGMHSYAK